MRKPQPRGAVSPKGLTFRGSVLKGGLEVWKSFAMCGDERVKHWLHLDSILRLQAIYVKLSIQMVVLVLKYSSFPALVLKFLVLIREKKF